MLSYSYINKKSYAVSVLTNLICLQNTVSPYLDYKLPKYGAWKLPM